MIDRYPGDMSNTHIGELRRYLANFGLGGEVLPNQKIHTMSGGQKCRLCLALAMYRKPHLLILDEPTNHLDSEFCFLDFLNVSFPEPRALIPPFPSLHLVHSGNFASFDRCHQRLSRWRCASFPRPTLADVCVQRLVCRGKWLHECAAWRHGQHGCLQRLQEGGRRWKTIERIELKISKFSVDVYR